MTRISINFLKAEKTLFLKMVLLSLIFTGFIFILHYWGEANSMLNRTSFQYNAVSGNYENAYLENVIHFHETNPNFSKRVINTGLIHFCSHNFGQSKGFWYIFLNAIYLVLSGFFLMRATQLLFHKPLITLLSGVLYYSNFTILFAFFAPIYTYDDILQYCFLFLSLIFLLKRQFFLFGLFFIAAVLLRESSLFITPLLLALLLKETKKRELFLFGGIVLLAIIFYLVSLQFTMGIPELWKETNNRWKYLAFNFSSFYHTVESLFAFLVIFTLPLVLCFKHYKKLKEQNSYIFWAFFFVFGFNTGLMLLTCLAREARLFNVPIILFLPFYSYLFFLEVNDYFKNWKHYITSVLFWLTIIPLAILSYWFVLNCYKTSIDLTSELLLKWYFFLHFMLLSLITASGLAKWTGGAKRKA